MGRRLLLLLVFLGLSCAAATAAATSDTTSTHLNAAEKNLQAWLKHVRDSSDPDADADASHPEIFSAAPGSSGLVHAPAAGAGPISHELEGAGPPCPERVIHVEQDGSGDFATVQAAIDSLPRRNRCRVDIRVSPGVFRERVSIPKRKAHVTLKGASRGRTIIAWNATAGDRDRRGLALGTMRSATVAVESNYFIAKNISFMNTAPAQRPGVVGRQAVALRISGDKAAFFNCHFFAHQDTLYDHRGRHYFKNCYVAGTVDFVFGNGRTLYEETELYADEDYGIPGSITAQKRNETTPDTGFSFVRSRIRGAGMVYLGRAWGDDSRVVFADSYMDKVVVPAGWGDWGIPAREKTVYYAQYNCTGPGADTAHRVKWARNLTAEEASPFLTVGFINGHSWLEGYKSTTPHH